MQILPRYFNRHENFSPRIIHQTRNSQPHSYFLQSHCISLMTITTPFCSHRPEPNTCKRTPKRNIKINPVNRSADGIRINPDKRIKKSLPCRGITIGKCFAIQHNNLARSLPSQRRRRKEFPFHSVHYCRWCELGFEAPRTRRYCVAVSEDLDLNISRRRRMRREEEKKDNKQR